MLKLSGVSARYGSVPAINNVSIEIGDGEAVGPRFRFAGLCCEHAGELRLVCFVKADLAVLRLVGHHLQRLCDGDDLGSVLVANRRVHDFPTLHVQRHELFR